MLESRQAWSRSPMILRVLLLALVAASCSADPSTEDCALGTLGCPCAEEGCESSAMCDSGRCVAIDAGLSDAGSGGDMGLTDVSDAGRADDLGIPDGGETGCGDTQSDPQNCGSCGYVCLSGTCNSGVCTPFLDECFSYGDYTTCSAACAASGRDCVQAGCDTTTFKVFGAQIYCSTEMDLLQFGTDECSAPISYPKAEALDFLRCCCR